jgi:hypothetical protein
MDLSSKTDEEFQAMVRKRLLGALNGGARQKIVGLDQLEDEIAGGWEFVSALPDGRAIMRIP